LDRKPLLIGDASAPAKRLAWCTGAAQGMLGEAIEAGAQIYMSGEISEPTVHLARETGVCYLSCGHHATERYGVQAMGEDLARQFGIDHRFIDIDSPVSAGLPVGAFSMPDYACQRSGRTVLIVLQG